MANRTDGGIFDDSNIWAETGDKTDPPFTETEGWDITYSQAGGNPVERTLLNRNFNKTSAALYDVNRFGANLAWSNLVQYEIGATVIGSDNVKYTSKTVNTNIDPVSDNGTNWKKDIPVITGDGSNINVSTDARNNVSVSLTSNLSDKANKTLDNVTVGDLLGRFESSNNITWSEAANKLKAEYGVPLLDANRKDLTITAADHGKMVFANADSVQSNITLPAFSSVPVGWYIDIYVFDAGYITYPTQLTSVKLVLQSGDTLQRASGIYNSTTGYTMRSPNTIVRLLKRENLSSWFLAGVLHNQWAANCTYTNIDKPTADSGITDVVLTEQADDRLAELNFNLSIGIVGDSTWTVSGGYYAKAHVIDLAPLNNVTNKYTTASLIRELSCQPIVFNGNFGQNRKFTAVTTAVSLVSTFGTAPNQTNQIEIAVQCPTTARTGDGIYVNVRLKFQNWLNRG
jgi:hypothetical protein